MNSGSVLSPKSTTVNSSFEFPNVTVPDNKTGSLGRHARQSSLDLNMLRSRSNSDAANKRPEATPIKKPAPPKFAKTSSADVANTSSSRVIAGITVPPRPPEVTPKKEPPVHPSESESVPVVSGFAANGPCVTPPITSEVAMVMHSESVEEDDEKSTESVDTEEKTGSTSVENSTEVTVANVVETTTTNVVETTTTSDDIIVTGTVDSTSAVKESNEEVEFHQPEIRAYSIQLAEVHYLPKEQLKEELKAPPSAETTTEQKSSTANESTANDDSSKTSTYKGFNTTVDMDSYGGILSTSGGSDWYRSMFQSMKKGVEEDLPEKKREIPFVK